MASRAPTRHLPNGYQGLRLILDCLCCFDWVRNQAEPQCWQMLRFLKSAATASTPRSSHASVNQSSVEETTLQPLVTLRRMKYVPLERVFLYADHKDVCLTPVLIFSSSAYSCHLPCLHPPPLLDRTYRPLESAVFLSIVLQCHARPRAQYDQHRCCG